MDIEEPIQGASVWKGPEIAHDASWVYQLSHDEIRELDGAIAAAKRAGGTLAALTRDHFELPKLAPAIRQ